MAAANSISSVLGMLKYAKSGPEVALGILGSVGHLAAQLSVPWIVGMIIDDALVNHRADILLQRCLLLGVAAAASVLCKGLYEISFSRWGVEATNALQLHMLGHLHRLPLARLEEQRSGQLGALFTNDARKVGLLYNPIYREGVYAVLQLVFLLVLVSWRYGSTVLLAGVLLPMYIAFPLLFSRKRREVSRQVQESEAEAQASFQEAIDGARDIKVFDRGDWSAGMLGSILRETGRRKVRGVFLNQLYGLDYVLYWTVIGLIYWHGGRQVLAGDISVGELVALVAYLGYLEAPISRLFTVYSNLQNMAGPLQRIQELLALPPEEEPGAAPAPPVRADPPQVELRGLTFRFPGNHTPVLDRVGAQLEAGQRVALVGPSGAGKTTLAKLLLRLYEPEEGEILFDGKDIRSLSLSALRSKVGIVFQDPFLFSLSIRENIRFGRPDATNEEVEQAARAANAHDFICRLPNGYDTGSGERGARLSVGQRQRIAIARTLLRNTPVVILDEATSALDAESESLVRQSLERLMLGRTSLVITHRLSTVLNADQILVLQEGRVIASGEHSGLLGECSLYRKFYDLQATA